MGDDHHVALGLGHQHLSDAAGPRREHVVQPLGAIGRLVVAGGAYEPGLPIVRGASLTVQRGEIVAILGPNGAGKSTLVKAVAGLVPVTGGRSLLFGQDITRVPAHRMVFEGLAFVPQTENVFANLSIAENLELAEMAEAEGDTAIQMLVDHPNTAKYISLNHSIGLAIDNDGRITGSRWDGPAFRAGIVTGMQILSVNGKAYDQETMRAAITAVDSLAMSSASSLPTSAVAS